MVRADSGHQVLRAFVDVSTDSSMGTVPTAISVETSLKAPHLGLDTRSTRFGEEVKCQKTRNSFKLQHKGKEAT